MSFKGLFVILMCKNLKHEGQLTQQGHSVSQVQMKVSDATCKNCHEKWGKGLLLMTELCTWDYLLLWVSLCTPHVPNFLSNCGTNILKTSGNRLPFLVNIQYQYEKAWHEPCQCIHSVKMHCYRKQATKVQDNKIWGQIGITLDIW